MKQQESREPRIKVRKDNSLTAEQRKHFENSLEHNHELMKRLAQM